MRNRKGTGLWTFLNASGVLDRGASVEEINAVKRAYRKQYMAEYKKEQRKVKPEYTVNLAREDELEKIQKAAKRHRMSVSAFLKAATLAYVQKSYLVPEREVIARLAQILMDCLNEIKAISSTRDRHSWRIEERYDAIERRIDILEADIQNLFRNPPSVEDAVRKAIATDERLRERLLTMLTHAHR